MAMDIILKVDGIEGESKIDGHENEIDVLAWNYDMAQPGSMHVGDGGSGKVNMEDVSLTKYVDKASVDLIRKCCNGAHLAEATLTVRKSGAIPLDYFITTMSPVMVASVSTGRHRRQRRRGAADRTGGLKFL